MTADELAGRRHKATLSKVGQARRRAELAGDALRTAILEAVGAGATHAQVAEKAGVSRARVTQIVGEQREPA